MAETPRNTPGLISRVARFLIGLAAIYLFAFGLLPALERLEPVREVHEAVEASGIDPTALFYTESEVSSEAESSIRNALRYPPRVSP